MAKKKSATSNQRNDGSGAIGDLSTVRLYLKPLGSGLQLSEIQTWWRSETAYRSERVPSQTGDIKRALAVLFTCYRLWRDSQRGQTADFVFDEFLDLWTAAKTQKGTVWYHAVFRQLLSKTFIEINRRTKQRNKNGEPKDVEVILYAVRLPSTIRIDFAHVTMGPREILNELVGAQEAQRLFEKYAQPTPTSFEKVLRAYSNECLNHWRASFLSDEEAEELRPAAENHQSRTTSRRSKDRPLFIHDQGLQILVGTQDNLQFDLHPSRMGGSAEKRDQFSFTGSATDSDSRWIPMIQSLSDGNSTSSVATDGHALLYRLDPSVASARGIQVEENERLLRPVIIADSGCGKTVRLRWIRTELLQHGSEMIPFLLNVDELRDADETLLKLLCRQFPKTEESAGIENLRDLRDAGKILLLLDAADQIRRRKTLEELLTCDRWRACPIVVSGRPEVIHGLCDTVPSSVGLQYVRPMELTDDQLERYIGPERYSKLENLEDAKNIVRNPRVAFYFGYVILKSQLTRIQTASDIFESATRHLLTTGLKSVDAWRLGTASSMKDRSTNAGRPPGFIPEDSQIERANGLLSAIALEQMLLPPEIDPEEGQAPAAGVEIPNFSGVNEDELGAFENSVYERIRRHDERYRGRRGWDLFKFDLQQLSAANVAITRGLLDVESPFREIRWRNKSLQEFYVARWLSNYATTEDINYLTERRYHPLKKDTFWFYWVQRFLCEMPRWGGLQESWAKAVEPFFYPGDGTVEGTHRSCEMIYRAWPRLNREAAKAGVPHAATVRNRFLGEFKDILEGKHDENKESGSRKLKPSQAAKELQDSFVEIPAGRFRMGAPEGKQGMGKKLWKKFEDKIKNMTLDEFLNEQLNRHRERSRTDRDWIKYVRQKWTRVYNEGPRVLEEWQFTHDETPQAGCEEVPIAAFRLSRYPVLNRWYRLFDPTHGSLNGPYEDYAQISGTDDRPLIYADWYMSWSFAQFCHWDGQSCDLPSEAEWEYAAKGEQTLVYWPDQYRDFWWGDDFDNGRHHCTSHSSRTTAPGDFTKTMGDGTPRAIHHENPFGLVDILGNVWEWTRDRYRSMYSFIATDGKSSSFVLRGGAWNNDDAAFLRCCRRNDNLPTYTSNDKGCRLSRTSQSSENLGPRSQLSPATCTAGSAEPFVES